MLFLALFLPYQTMLIGGVLHLEGTQVSAARFRKKEGKQHNENICRTRADAHRDAERQCSAEESDHCGHYCPNGPAGIAAEALSCTAYAGREEFSKERTRAPAAVPDCKVPRTKPRKNVVV